MIGDENIHLSTGKLLYIQNTKIIPGQSPIIITPRKWTSWRGGHWGVPKPAIPKKNKQTNKQKTKGKIPICCVKNRRTAFKIGHAYLKLYQSRVFVFSQACIHEKSTSAIAARKRETSNWWTQWSKSPVIGSMSYQFHHRLTVRNCLTTHLSLSLKCSNIDLN